MPQWLKPVAFIQDKFKKNLADSLGVSSNQVIFPFQESFSFLSADGITTRLKVDIASIKAGSVSVETRIVNIVDIGKATKVCGTIALLDIKCDNRNLPFAVGFYSF